MQGEQESPPGLYHLTLGMLATLGDSRASGLRRMHAASASQKEGKAGKAKEEKGLALFNFAFKHSQVGF